MEGRETLDGIFDPSSAAFRGQRSKVGRLPFESGQGQGMTFVSLGRFERTVNSSKIDGFESGGPLALI